MDEGTEQPRIPGVRYHKVTRHRYETVTIDGQPETREVPYDVWVPVPPRDWDQIIVRAVTAVAICVTVLAVIGTTASIGGLLVTLVPAVIAYSVAVVFDVTWLSCIAVEWLERFDPKRARAARRAGWAALLISMAAVVAFGHHYGETVAGGAGAAVALLAKSLWWLVLRYYAVPLSDGVAFWLRRRREKLAANMALSGQLRRLNADEAYMKAAFGAEAARAAAITGSPADMLAPVSGQHPDVPGIDVRIETADPGDVGAAAVPGQPSGTASGASEDEGSVAGPSGGGGEEDVVRPIGGTTIAATIRAVLEVEPEISDGDLTAKVASVHGHRDNLSETVRRTRDRIKQKQKKSVS